MMAESAPLAFVQIAAAGEALYGLDADGQVWRYRSGGGWLSDGWHPCPMTRLMMTPLPVPTGLTTVARTPDVR